LPFSVGVCALIALAADDAFGYPADALVTGLRLEQRSMPGIGRAGLP
jgi:hypothetical protein